MYVYICGSTCIYFYMYIIIYYIIYIFIYLYATAVHEETLGMSMYACICTYIRLYKYKRCCVYLCAYILYMAYILTYPQLLDTEIHTMHTYSHAMYVLCLPSMSSHIYLYIHMCANMHLFTHMQHKIILYLHQHALPHEHKRMLYVCLHTYARRHYNICM